MARISSSRRRCPHARSVRKGYRITRLEKKARRLCLDCGAHYTPDDGFKRMRYRKEIIAIAIDLYRQGLSRTKVSVFLLHHFEVKVSGVTVLKWVNKYSRLLQDHVATLRPTVKGTVHLDEKLVRFMKGHQRYWGAKDQKTKFRLASHLSKSAEKEEAYQLFDRLIRGTRGKFRLFVSDKLGAYQRAFNKFFRGWARVKGRGRPRLNHGVPIGCRKHGLTRNNNPIERDNQRIGRRVVLTRGFKDERSAWNILQFLDIGYNFLDPHWGLGGKTPADRAGVGLPAGANPLMRMIFLYR